jgi:hypothetical protein
MTMIRLCVTAIAIVLLTGCQKEKYAENPDCSSGAVLQSVVDQPAVVIQLGSDYYLIPEGSIDSRYYPCSIPEAFRVNDLPVKITGDIRAKASAGPRPCCDYWIQLFSISRR